MNRFAIVCTVLMLSIFPGYSSAAVIYDIYTNTELFGSNLLTGSIGFENLASDYQGAVTASDITLFEFDGSVLGNYVAPAPADWQPSSLTGTIDVANSSLFIQDLVALVEPAIGQVSINNTGTSSTGGFGYVFGLYGVPGEAYLQPRTSVPEASGISLLAIGMAVFGLVRRKKQGLIVPKPASSI
jgi:hypothetical protein